jgi:hypothetical protein
MIAKPDKTLHLTDVTRIIVQIGKLLDVEKLDYLIVSQSK